MKYIILIFLLAFYSCSSHNHEKNHQNNLNKSLEIKERNAAFLKNIQGVWALKEGENANFEIIGDSIFYIEHPDSKVTYKIMDDTFMVYYEGYTTKNIIIKLDADSFVCKSSTGYIDRYYHRKK